MTALQRLKAYARRQWFYLLFPAAFVLISLILILVNGSFTFEYDYLNRFGDQKLYFGIAHGLLHGDFQKNYYTIGYPLLYLPFIILTGIQASWTSIMASLIFFQAIILVPVTIFVLFKDKSKKNALITSALMAVYYLLFLLRSADPLTKYNFWGLIPLSEPLAVFCLILSYYVYLKYVRAKMPDFKYLIVLAALIGWGLLTRNTSLILFLPIFIDLLMDRRFRRFLSLGVLVGLFYLPQLIYNYLCSGDILFNGYLWASQNRMEKNAETIQHLYGIRSSSLFSLRYLPINLKDLALQYVPLLALVVVNMIKKNRFVVLVCLFSVVNLVFHLTYWWSKAGGLIDRFLLPNVMLLLFIFGNRLICNQKRAKEN